MSEILIASASIDKPTYGPVAEKLDDRGFDVFLYLADRVARGEDTFSVSTTPQGGLNFSYNGVPKNLDRVHAGWYRHPNLVNLDEEDKAKKICIEDEISSLQDVWWQQIPESLWLNSPERNQKAQTKLAQLATASTLGFNIPETIISNSWESIDRYLQTDDVIVKMARGVLYEDDETKVLYTTRLNSVAKSELRLALPFPAIFQNYASKSREWRVTVVGDEVFEASIYTDKDAKDDWRKHQFTDRVTFKKENLDEDIKLKCIQFLGEYGLRYGAFDFIENQDGKVTFLECNPNGQYMWLEESLGLQISDAITNELVRIASI